MTTFEKPRVKIDLWDYIGDVPPPFGRPMLEFFSFDPGYVNLNQGQGRVCLRGNHVF